MNLLKSFACAVGVLSSAPFIATAHAVPISDLSAIPTKLTGAAVTDQKGSRVGVVHKVDTSANGKVSRLTVSVFGGQKIVALEIKGLDYDEPTNVVKVTLLDKSQIEQLGPVAS